MPKAACLPMQVFLPVLLNPLPDELDAVRKAGLYTSGTTQARFKLCCRTSSRFGALPTSLVAAAIKRWQVNRQITLTRARLF